MSNRGVMNNTLDKYGYMCILRMKVSTLTLKERYTTSEEHLHCYQQIT